MYNNIIPKPLFTHGDEFSLNGNPYIGFYHLHGTHQYTGKVHDMRTSKRLKTLSEEIQADLYDSLRSSFSTETRVYAVHSKPIPTKQDYRIGYFIRYFVQKVNDPESAIVEVSKEDFDTLGEFYKKISLRWKVSGNIDDTYDGTELKYRGAYSTNTRTLEKKELEMKGISNFLVDRLEFFKG